VNIYGDLFSTKAIVTKTVFIYKRSKPKNILVRMGMLYIGAGEMWYLRILLLNKSADSFHTIKSVDGVEYSSFQAAAIASGFVQHNQESQICFNDAIH
jgi:hypothetical protein